MAALSTLGITILKCKRLRERPTPHSMEVDAGIWVKVWTYSHTELLAFMLWTGQKPRTSHHTQNEIHSPQPRPCHLLPGHCSPTYKATHVLATCCPLEHCAWPGACSPWQTAMLQGSIESAPSFPRGSSSRVSSSKEPPVIILLLPHRHCPFNFKP